MKDKHMLLVDFRSKSTSAKMIPMEDMLIADFRIGNNSAKRAQMEYRSNSRLKGISCGKYTSKRKRSQLHFQSTRRRRLNVQGTNPCQLNVQSLPEDIVVKIISEFTLKEAVQMSVVSSNWRQAWKFHPNLYFGIKTVLGSNAKRKGANSDLTNRFLNADKFIERVDAILGSHCRTTVNKFAVKFALTKEHANHIDGWVSFSIASKARILTLNFSPDRVTSENNYEFPCRLFNRQNGSHIQALRLDSVTLSPPPDFCGFGNLKMLALEKVIVFQDLQHFLSNCLVLEWLSIQSCYQLHNLHVSEPLCRLLYLCVQNCAGVRKIEFNAPRLTTFQYSGSQALINLNECLKLNTASIRLNVKTRKSLKYVFTGIPDVLPHVETLYVEVIVLNQMSRFVQPSLKYMQLRHLTMEVQFMGRADENSAFQLAYLLEAAPCLEDLRLIMLYLLSFGELIDLDDITDRPHYYLKTVRISGFCGNPGQVELAKYILRNALILEHMIVETRGNFKTTVPEEEDAREIAKEMLVPEDMDGVLTIL